MFDLTTLVVLFMAAISNAKASKDGIEIIQTGPTGEHQHSGSSILSFDDIPTVAGLATIPSPYHHLTFSSYNVISPGDPGLDGRISPHDLNCAVSAPNALIGSRDYTDSVTSPVKATFRIANATAMVEQGFFPYFDMLSFYVKPMDAPPPGSTVYVKGYSHSRREPFEWGVDFITGYHLPLLVKVRQYTGEAWNQLHKVEIWADFGDDALDWEFCVDDLEVRFHETIEVQETTEAHEKTEVHETTEVVGEQGVAEQAVFAGWMEA